MIRRLLKRLLSPPLSIGVRAEKAACRYLKKQGLRCLRQNYRSRFGEIDLIMQSADTLVFVEVRYRSNPRYGSAAESITTQKQQKIIKTALCFVKSYPVTPKMRFDAICLDNFIANPEKKWQFDWIKNAFQVDSAL